MRDDGVSEALSALSATDDNAVNKLSTNASMYDKVASRLSEQLLAALAWSAQTRAPNIVDSNAADVTTNISSTSVSPSRRSWETFLAQLVSNLSSEAHAAVSYTHLTLPTKRIV